ncbi:MAG: ABC transporter ATP-binding protein [Planctomycetes bacterium]|nr:ABC transporter ATP-binding protein [Planctomycetota bacterium]
MTRWLERWIQGLAVARRFFPELAVHRWRLAAITALTLAAVAFELLRPWPIKWILDYALPGGAHAGESPFDWLGGPTDAQGIVLWGALAALVIVILDSLCDYGAAVLTNQVGQAVSRSLRLRVFEHLSKLSPEFHARFKSGDLLVRLMGDVPLVRTMLVDSTVAVLTRSCLIACTVGAMLFVDAWLTLIVLGIIPACLGVVWWISKQLTIAARKQRTKEGDLADYLHEAIAASSTIQALGRGRHIVHRFAHTNRTAARAELKAARLSAKLTVSIEAIFGTCTAAALGFGAWRVLQGTLSAGDLILFLSYVRSLLKPVRATSKHSERLAKGTASGERLLAILDEPIAIDSRPDAIEAPAHPAELEFRDVVFQYGKKVDALRGFAATFKRGELLGLFGRSGSGKSTVAALCVRLYDPDAGTVLLDGRPLPEYQLQSLRDRFGLSMQESTLFGASIRENLLLGRPEATEEELWEALRLSAADGFVANLKRGLDTELGSGGTGLSGGERRRLCLARVLLRRAPVLIVDEPFSGLDRVAVDRVRATLSERARTDIVVVIAHDLDHLDVFDRIVFVDQGRVDDVGTHAELVARNALYRRTTRSLSQAAS